MLVGTNGIKMYNLLYSKRETKLTLMVSGIKKISGLISIEVDGRILYQTRNQPAINDSFGVS